MVIGKRVLKSTGMRLNQVAVRDGYIKTVLPDSHGLMRYGGFEGPRTGFDSI